jgi:two-component system, OmpR family, sensor kinase
VWQVAALERWARRGGDARLATEIARARRTIHRYAKRAALLLDVTRLNAGRLDLQVAPVRLSELIADVADAFADEAAFRDATLQIDAQPSLVGEWDAQSIEAIVSNLVSNALKYGDGGTVRIAAQPDGPGWARLAVTDDGPGIDAAQRRRIFEKFERVVDGDSERGGFGLGLWIVGRLVSAHGGTIGIDAAPGAGSTFTVRLPLHPEPLRNDTTGA